MLAPQVRQNCQPVTLKLDTRLLTLLKHYAEFITSSPEYILNQALLVAFSADRDFQAWLADTHLEDGGRLPELAADQPRAEPVGRLCSRPAGWAKVPVASTAHASPAPTKDGR